MTSAPLIVVSGPSGVGKSTVVAAALAEDSSVWLSVSATTRLPREGEIEGVNYFFVSAERFESMIESGEFLEWAEFAGHRYGTPRGPVEERRAGGTPVILEIELQGARQVRQSDSTARLVFLAPPSWGVLEARLTGRGTESPEAVAARLDAARSELAAQGEFDDVVVNTDVRESAQSLLDLLRG
jgi:guanylate kinase